MKIGITVNKGDFESLRFDSDDLPEEEAYLQLKDQLEEWADVIPRCSWWITQINNILTRMGPPEILAPAVPIVKTIVKSSPLSAPAPMNPDDRYTYLNKDGKPYMCNKCHGLISWDKYPGVKHPIHVDKDGKIMGDGSCPNFH